MVLACSAILYQDQLMLRQMTRAPWYSALDPRNANDLELLLNGLDVLARGMKSCF